MRLPHFADTCPHIADEIQPLNGGRFNIDHYLRTLRERMVNDPTVIRGANWHWLPKPFVAEAEADRLVDVLQTGELPSEQEFEYMERVVDLYCGVEP